jgi:hypothetical protein
MPPEEESQLTDSTSQNNNMGDTETSVYPCYADGEEVDDEFFQDCTQSPQSLYYSSHVLSNHSPSPSALSFGETDIQPFGSGRMCQSTCAPHAKYIDRSDQDTIDPNTSTSSADNEPVALFRNDYSYMRTYPSGRPPLIPLDTDFVENTKKERKTKREAKTTSKKENPKETVSWISRSLCAVHTDSSFDSTEHGRDSDVDFSKDANICFPFDEEGSREYEEADDDCTEDINDYRCNSPLIDKTIMTNDDTRKESVEIEVKPEIFNSLDDFFRQNRMLCNTLESWYNEIEQKSDIIQLSPNCHKNHVSPHNSSNNLITRKRRVQRLRHNMAPFDVDQIELNQGVVNMKKYSPVESDRIKFSFSNTVSTAYRRKPEVKHTSLASSYNTAQVRECAPISITTGCGNFGDMPDIDIVPTEEEDGDSDNENINTCYDSDPTDLLPSLQTPKRRERYKSRRFKRHIHLNVNDIDEDTCLEKVSYVFTLHLGLGNGRKGQKMNLLAQSNSIVSLLHPLLDLRTYEC